MKLIVVTAPGAKIEIEHEQSPYCPSEQAFFLPDKMSPFEWARTIDQADKERNEWIRRYENMYEGLKYWRNRALEKMDNQCMHQNYTSTSYGPEDEPPLMIVCRCNDCGEYFIISNETDVDKPESTS